MAVVGLMEWGGGRRINDGGGDDDDDGYDYDLG